MKNSTVNLTEPSPQEIDAMIAEARKVLREEHRKVLQFNPSVGREGELIDLISRLTTALMVLQRDAEVDRLGLT